MTNRALPRDSPLDLYWGNDGFAIKIAENVPAKDRLKVFRDWMVENDHYFHIQHWHYTRVWKEGEIYVHDYGSYVHFLYAIPHH